MSANPSATLSFAEWKAVAVDCLRERWPQTDRRQLEGIAAELFADPYRGRLDPDEAVEDWMQYLSA